METFDACSRHSRLEGGSAKASAERSEIPPNLRAIGAIAVAELSIEVAFFPQHDADLHHDEERSEYDDAPPCVHCQREAEIQQREGDVQRISRVAERPGGDDGGGRQAGVDVRAGGLHRTPTHLASAIAATPSARPAGNAIAHAVIGNGRNNRKTTARRKAPAYSSGGRAITPGRSGVADSTGMRSASLRLRQHRRGV